MRNLHFYFSNPFSGRLYGINKLEAFTAHHLRQLAENNSSGIYDERIAATQAAFDAVNNAIQQDASNLGEREAAKGQKKQFKKSLPENVGKIYLAVVAKFGLKAPMLSEFFPNGRSLFHKCREAILEDELGVLVTAVTKYQSDLPPETLALAKELQTDWQTLYGASKSSSGAKSHTEIVKRNAIKALQHELFLNLLMLAQQYAEQPEMLKRFMQQSLLTRHRRQAVEKNEDFTPVAIA